MFLGIFVALLIAVTQPPDNEAYRRKGSLQLPVEFENKVHHGHRSVRYPSDVTPSVRGQKVLSSLSPFCLVRNASPWVMLSSFKTDPFLIKPVRNTFLESPTGISLWWSYTSLIWKWLSIVLGMLQNHMISGEEKPSRYLVKLANMWRVRPEAQVKCLCLCLLSLFLFTLFTFAQKLHGLHCFVFWNSQFELIQFLKLGAASPFLRIHVTFGYNFLVVWLKWLFLKLSYTKTRSSGEFASILIV